MKTFGVARATLLSTEAKQFHPERHHFAYAKHKFEEQPTETLLQLKFIPKNSPARPVIASGGANVHVRGRSGSPCAVCLLDSILPSPGSQVRRGHEFGQHLLMYRSSACHPAFERSLGTRNRIHKFYGHISKVTVPTQAIIRLLQPEESGRPLKNGTPRYARKAFGSAEVESCFVDRSVSMADRVSA